MEDKILLGRDRNILEIPQANWKEHLALVPEHSQARLSFMTADHHRVRYFVVRALMETQQPLEPAFISRSLDLPLERVASILEELEQKLVFLVRDEHGAVAWAYPVTVQLTPHMLNFSTGERLYGA